ncbi:YciI family protein [Novosphingobium beihaiensis]|uniref:YciI family protein n=1 Tax=Novosphingobium beihaiensis TaxID=2930389 RepID=A0ABT0BNK6_9SPHN|nr:YciI family protein [Novosphingobium beihaiensis]MCJ2186621.1 YciI family protein [Novosphingobium beihaiensis]
MALFILSLRYTAPIEVVDALLPDHAAWLKANHAEGRFLAWGRKVPRDGGIILARGESREAVAALAATDPFVAGGAAEVEVIEWSPTFAGEGLEGLTP